MGNFQPERSWLKAVASLRRNSQLVADAGFHFEMSALNSLQPENRPLAF